MTTDLWTVVLKDELVKKLKEKDGATNEKKNKNKIWVAK
jgi:hypothetical protein